MHDVRPIGPDQWSLWRALRLQALEEAPYAFNSTLAEWRAERDTEARWRARLSMTPLNAVAYLDRRLAGMVSGTAADEAGAIELISMYVAPFARGRGVGDALVGCVIDWARQQQAARVTLNVVEANRHAVALYARHGFTDAGPVDCKGTGIAADRRMVLDLKN